MPSHVSYPYVRVGFIPLIYLALLTLAQALILLQLPLIGLSLHGTALLALLVYSMTCRTDPLWLLLLVLSVIPLLQLLALLLPLSELALISNYALLVFWPVTVFYGGRALLRQRVQPEVPDDDFPEHTWEAQVADLLAMTAPDVAALEQLAFLLWERLDPVYVLIIVRDEQRDQGRIEMAIGATGWHLRSFEGMTQPWPIIETALAGGVAHPAFREIQSHPFSRYTGDYLVLPLRQVQRWVIIQVDQGQGPRNRATLARLGVVG